MHNLRLINIHRLLLIFCLVVLVFVPTHTAYGADTAASNSIATKKFVDKKYSYEILIPKEWKVKKEKPIIDRVNKLVSRTRFIGKDNTLTVTVNLNEWKLKKEAPTGEFVNIAGTTTWAYGFPYGYECQMAKPDQKECGFAMINLFHDGKWYEIRITGDFEKFDEDMLSSFQFLTSKVKSQSNISRKNKKSKSETLIELISPKENQTIALGEPIEISWKHKNAPSNTQVVYSVTLVTAAPSKNQHYSTGGTGTTIKKIKKDGNGKQSWGTGLPGSGLLDTPGTYRIEASIRDCHPQGCEMNATFPGLNLPIRTYATSSPITINIIEEDVEKDYSKPSARLLSPHSGKYHIGDKMIIMWENNQLPSGSQVCAYIQNFKNNKFVFTDDNDHCISSMLMKKTNIFSGTLVRTPGYALVPGKYRISLEVMTPSDTPVSAGKEGGKRENEVGGWFEIL